MSAPRVLIGAALVGVMLGAAATPAPAQQKKKAPPPQPKKAPPNDPQPPPRDELGELGPRPTPPAPSADGFIGAWKAAMTAEYSSCDDVKLGDVRNVRWAIAAGKKPGEATLTEKNGGKTNPKSYTGAVDGNGKLSLRAGKQAGLELQSDGVGLMGRHVAVRKGNCAVVWTVYAERATDEPLQVGTTDPDAGGFSLEQALAGLPATGVLAVDIDTAQGTITCELYPSLAPQTVASFVGLARGLRAWRDPKDGKWWRYRPYYDGLWFHRVIPDFIIQGGDPQSRDAKAEGLGTGGPGYTIPDENGNGLRFDVPGRLAMANKGPNTNSAGSQFFITEVRAPSIDGAYTIFGQCGPVDVVKSIARVPADANTHKPTQPQLMKVRVYKK